MNRPHPSDIWPRRTVSIDLSHLVTAALAAERDRDREQCEALFAVEEAGVGL